MKKVLALVLAFVMVLSLTACGGNSNGGDKKESTDGTTEGNKGIELTLDNYKKYLDISADYDGTGQVDIHLVTPNQEGIHTGNGFYSWMIYEDGFSGEIKSSAISKNFIYEDIIIKGKVKGKYDAYSMETITREKSIDFDQDYTLECNIDGEATQKLTIDIPDGYGSLPEFLEYDIEVDSITGYVSPVGK